MNSEIIRYNNRFRQDLFYMMKDFYSSDAVLHDIDEKNFEKTIDLLEKKSDFADCFIIEVNEKVAGYVLLAFTYSNEVGGMVVWIEEIYLKLEYRGKYLAKSIVDFLLSNYTDAKRFRMEAVKTNDVSIGLFKNYKFENLDYLQFIKDV